MINLKWLTAASVLICGVFVYTPFFSELFDHLIEKSFLEERNPDIANMSVYQKIAQNVLLKAPAGPETTFSEVWKERRSVIVFFRRFG